MKLPSALEQYARECNLSWDQFRSDTGRQDRAKWDAHVKAHAGTIIVRDDLRAQLIRTGAILPLEDRPTLRLDDKGRDAAAHDIATDRDFTPWDKKHPGFRAWSPMLFLDSLGWPFGTPDAEPHYAEVA